ncbi:TetR/AcrR family transcriptional regulator [Vibrio sp. IRLE0018]|uniref:TetR/AcrR family transcriptional regulator n=1 Tax=Vibrio TaxID=662 RepID=UPI0015947083|nr:MULTISPECIES: TetR/AcrR family transcriptional regulator [Vibrio]MCF8780126.1 TetR/AcrR family transcriptional regulator [Vibrio floridensis]NVC64972.1 helix-turn-helix transcriptional regulator [Vibrio sp. 05-20-BW147]HAS6349544.1 TetR family transcriptional regulator [Vibrio vulnificus]
MPRVSQATAKKTRQAIVDASFKILLLEGYEHLTYSRIAEKTGVSRSCVNGHFKRKEELLGELKPKAVEQIVQALEFSSPDEFYSSWVKAVNEDRMFRNLIQNVGEMICSAEGRQSLMSRISGDQEEVEKALYMAIGYAIVHISCPIC